MADDKSSEVSEKRSGRFRRWSYLLAALIVIVAVALYFTGHLPGASKTADTSTTLPPPVGSGYLATTPTSVLFIQWYQTGTTATGVAQIASIEGQPPNQTVTVKTTKATGQINGSNVSVDFAGVTEVFGTTSGGGFVLDFAQPDGSLAPVTFRKASAQDYNDALAALRSQVNTANAGASSTTSTS